MLALFDAYVADAEGAPHGCAFLNAAGELRGDHPGLAVIREHKRAVRDEVRRLLEEELDPERADELTEHVFLLLEGGIAHRGIDSRMNGVAVAQAVVARLLSD